MKIIITIIIITLPLGWQDQYYKNFKVTIQIFKLMFRHDSPFSTVLNTLTVWVREQLQISNAVTATILRVQVHHCQLENWVIVVL